MSDSTDLTVLQARKIVKEIAKKKGWISQKARENSDPETLEALKSVREELGDAVDTIARDIYAQKARFVLELIQNAEDNKYTRASSLKKDPFISFEVHPSKITVECNEDGFTEANVISICRSGRSPKKSQRGHIGEKSIGFKSVFQVASKVHIQSNSFSFSFRYGEDKKKDRLGIVTPVLEDTLIPPHDRPLTRMTLTPVQNLSYEDLVAQFDDIPDTLLLFLSTLKQLQIRIHHSNQKTTITTYHRSDDPLTSMTTLIKTVESQEKKDVTETRYHIEKKSISRLPIDKDRPGIEHCEVVLAFPLDEALSPLISQQYVFNFLPIQKSKFSFLIQADFILEDNRQYVVDSPRNRAVLLGVAKTFSDAVLQFCRSGSPLQYQWVRFLPSGQTIDKVWQMLSMHITAYLGGKAILYSDKSLKPCQPKDLRTLPASYLDKDGLPLFEDLSGVGERYLSLGYEMKDIEILKRTFQIQEISSIEIFSRISQDLSKGPSSKMMAFSTDDDWHSRAADLIYSICRQSPTVKSRVLHSDLIPLPNGHWVKASTKGLCWPDMLVGLLRGPDIPGDLLTTIDPKATKNPKRKRLFRELGITDYTPERVMDRLWKLYQRDGGASNLRYSMEHIHYLYWHYSDLSDPRFRAIWLYDSDGNKVTSRQKILYFESENEYDAQELLKGFKYVKNPQATVPQCPVPFLNAVYRHMFTSNKDSLRISWQSWLEKAMGVRHIPRLRMDTGSLSTEFRHIIQYRPDKVIGTLKAHWSIYKHEMSPSIVKTLSQAKVASSVGHTSLKDLYIPLQELKELAQTLGVSGKFPFLEMPNDSGYHRFIRDWRFLEEFGVQLEADLTFYVMVLRLHRIRKYNDWGNKAKNYILETYESIANSCIDKDKDWLWTELNSRELILDPSSFHEDASGPRWTNIERCVWNGPTDLLDKKPLSSFARYGRSKSLVRLFREILDVEDAGWIDYLRALSNLRDSKSSENVAEKARKLYLILSKDIISNEDWVRIIECFEENGLIYVPSTSHWVSPSDCLWESPVPIASKRVIGCYYSDLKSFFLERLSISPGSLNKLVNGLKDLSQRSPSVSEIKKTIWAVNTMNPKKGDLDILLTSDILPMRLSRPGSRESISLQSCQSDFVINDRSKLASIFDGHVAFLDFTLEEVQELNPVLHSLGIENKYLSLICLEYTDCTEDGIIDKRLTNEFHIRAYSLLRCAVFFRSPRVTKAPQSMYDLLLATSIYTTGGISTRHTIQMAKEIQSLHVPQGYVHIRDREDGWQIFIPQDRRDRELCYARQFPEALTKLFQITPAAREIIGNVLNSSILILDDILEDSGIGFVQGIKPLPQSSLRGLAGEEIIEKEEATAHFKKSTSSVSTIADRRQLIFPAQGSNFPAYKGANMQPF